MALIVESEFKKDYQRLGFTMRKFFMAINVALGLGLVIASLVMKSQILFVAGVTCFNMAVYLWWYGLSDKIVRCSEELQLANERIMESNDKLRNVVREYQYICGDQLNELKKLKGVNNASIN